MEPGRCLGEAGELSAMRPLRKNIMTRQDRVSPQEYHTLSNLSTCTYSFSPAT